jgi:hypothetical protein
LESDADGSADVSTDVTMCQQIGKSLIAGDYGSGHVIIDGLGICDFINAENNQDSIKPFGYANVPVFEKAQMASAYNGLDLTDYAASPASDLEFLVNVISYATASPNPGANVRGNGNQGGNLAGALTPTWQSGFGNGAQPGGVAVYGQYVFTTDSTGLVSCFNINPPQVSTQSNQSYQLFWSQSIGSAASAPVVALIPNGAPKDPANVEAVLVEDIYGNVYAFSAVAPGTLVYKVGNASSAKFTGTVPSPTYYRGQILAPQPGGAGGVIVYNCPSNGTPTAIGTFSASQSTTNGDWVGPPLVASVPSTDGTYSGDEIVGYAPTGSGVQTLQLGSRDEQITPASGSVTNASSYYTTKAGQLGTTVNDKLIGAPEDTGGTINGAFWLMDYTPSVPPSIFISATTPAPAGNLQASAGDDKPGIYADYTVEEVNAPPYRTFLTAASGANTSASINTVQGAAVGPDNLLYITVNEGAPSIGPAYIEAVNEQAPVNANSAITWRFELNNMTADASGIFYDFKGFTFKGAPIVGNNGMIYALATNNVETRLMAFNANPSVGFTNPFTLCTITQPDENSGNPVQVPTTQFSGDWQITNFSATKQGTLSPSVYAPGILQVTQQQSAQGVTTSTGGATSIAINTAWNGAAPMLEWYTQLPTTGVNSPIIVPTSPPRMIGDYIYFGYSGATNATSSYGIASVLADPSKVGLEADPVTRAIPHDADYRFTQVVPSSVGPIRYIGASDAYLVAQGDAGVQAFAYNSVLIADGNRLIELDPDGNATWTMDSTQEPAQSTALGASTPIQSTTATTFGGTSAGVLSSSVPLNRPSTVTQISTNDFLIADTGNNRCVHVDRSGNVLTQLSDSSGNILLLQPGQFNGSNFTLLNPGTTAPSPYNLEFTTFNDPLGLLPVGEPNTLSQPQSVVTWLTYEYRNGTAAGTLATAINAHYLIADTGNSRLLDIVDRYTEVTSSTGVPTNTYALDAPTLDVNGVPVTQDYHYLNWISHTSDVAGRSYGYVGGQPVLYNATAPATAPPAVPPYLMTPKYPDGTYQEASAANQAVAIIGVVGDKRISGLDTSQTTNFPQIGQDSPGSSILLFYYTNGWEYPYPASPTTNPGVKSGLPYQLINSVAYGDPTAPTILPLRGLRSAIAETYDVSNPTTSTSTSLATMIIADDDGVFAGTYAATNPTNLGSNFTKPPYSATYLMDATYGSPSPSQPPGFQFLQADYTNIVYQYNNTQAALAPLASGPYENYSGTTLFVPASVYLLSGNNYLIVNRGAAGNANSPTIPGNADNGFGGDVFIVHATTSSSGPSVSTLDGNIYGHPK